MGMINSLKFTSTVALNHKEIGLHSERVSNIKPFINKYNRDEIRYP